MLRTFINECEELIDTTCVYAPPYAGGVHFLNSLSLTDTSDFTWLYSALWSVRQSFSGTARIRGHSDFSHLPNSDLFLSRRMRARKNESPLPKRRSDVPGSELPSSSSTPPWTSLM